MPQGRLKCSIPGMDIVENINAPLMNRPEQKRRGMGTAGIDVCIVVVGVLKSSHKGMTEISYWYYGLSLLWVQKIITVPNTSITTGVDCIIVVLHITCNNF